MPRSAQPASQPVRFPLRHAPKTLLLSAIAAALAAPAAMAQLEEVVVTAQKRAESQQDIPIAITTLSNTEMEKRGIYNFIDIAKAVPSLSETVYPSSNMLILYMRGQGVADSMQITSDGSVGFYVDGHYIARPQGVLFDIADTERVEVLRGPQGTLYGRNTTGGAINLISRKPTGEFGVRQNLSMGSRDFMRSLTLIDLPEVGGVSSKMSILSRKQDGYVENAGASNDYGEVEELAGRVALRWAASDTFEAEYFLETGSQDSTPIYYQSGFPLYPGYVDASRPVGVTHRPIDLPISTTEFEGHGLTLTWQANDNLTIKSLTGYRELDFDGFQDYAESFGVPTRSIDYVNNYQFSQDLQFIGSAGDDVEYVAGLYYFKESSSHFQNYVLDLNAIGQGIVDKHRDVDAQSWSRAAYAQVTWTPPVLEQRLDVTVGARYTEDRRKASRDFLINTFPIELGASNRQSFEEFNPSLTLNYAWNDTLTTYAKWVTAYKAGGSSESSAPGQFDQTFDPEDVTTYEVGMKSDWWDRRLRVNAALFYSEFDDMQLQFVADAFDTSVIQAYNAGEANVAGAELEVTVMPTPDLLLKFDYTHLRPRFDVVEVLPGTVFDPAVNPMSPHQVGDNIKDLFVLPYAPRNSLSLTADYTFYRFSNGELSANLSYRRQSNTYLSSPAGPDIEGREFYRQDGYGLMDARLTMSLEFADARSLQLALWGRNITDRDYRQHVIGLGGGGAVATPISAKGYTYAAESWAEPATYGVEVIFEY